MKIPTTLNEAIEAIDILFPPGDKERIERCTEEALRAITHHTLGRQIRNDWGLWTSSELSKRFNQVGIFHPDDMSGIIFTSYYRKVHNLPFELEKQIRHCIEYWLPLNIPELFGRPAELI